MSTEPSVSVVITAHNEAEGIAACLKSVSQNEAWMRGDVEIILVDDRSQDATSEIARSLGLHNLRILRIDSYTNTELTARQVALNLGIQEARGEIVLLTDADSLVSTRWIDRMIAPISDNRADAVAGLIDFRAGNILLRWLQSVDAVYYFNLCRALNGVGFKSGGFFGNFALKKEIYERLGGFQKIGFALNEDLFFMRHMHARGCRIVFDSSESPSVQACRDGKQMMARFQRVTSGGVSLLSSVIWVWMIPFFPLLVLSFWDQLFLFLFCVRYVLSLGFVIPTLIRRRRYSLLPFVFLYEATILSLEALALLLRKKYKTIEWKGIHYRR